MRRTLQRSCASCARAKHSCDLGTPRCSRCVKRGVQCAYANEPLSAPIPNAETQHGIRGSGALMTRCPFPPVDPFESYPQTRLARDHVQRLIHSFLNKIAFQYYPLDLSAASNPFLVSWWPLALGDPALFHVSLQTACLDEELLAQRGFAASEMLMADSVVLLRRKVEDAALAVQDGTMNSVITLATIEFGKGNIAVAMMHLDGVVKLVNLRGGINSVRQTSPLTARMVSWVSLLITGHPQFETQDDEGVGDGIPPIAGWEIDSSAAAEGMGMAELDEVAVDPGVANVFVRLRHVLKRAGRAPSRFPTTRLHDLTCFVVHRLLRLSPSRARGDASPPSPSPSPSPISECLRYAMVLFMLIIQGPTYYSHAVLQDVIVARLRDQLEMAASEYRVYGPIDVWILAVAMVSSAGTAPYAQFAARGCEVAASLELRNGIDAIEVVKGVLWLPTVSCEGIFQSHWDAVLGGEAQEPSIVRASCSAAGDLSMVCRDQDREWV
ncbi:hypothetical protein QBC39DRAFT_122877 [Podospora conica]|nr:hypothetical protein QBC39DRAFT_122877 [Schizothecium conicum]